ncbi:creatine kinase M-type [Pundamilia nyererei]|uniref:creatine kinase n=1 Tax=Pundamilia nyererei TaxID=303518 RepID=A0A9Y6JL33_9CICH|nr:PREDICTED: creatine kinase M-type-like [Pundamilia nyererei]
MWRVKPPVTFPKEVKYRPILENLIPPDPMARFHLKRGFPQEEFPDLCRNFTWMGRILTLDLYRRQFNRCTQSGVIFDDVIRPGLEEPGDYLGPVAVGCVAGDAESYILFCDFFDRVIEAYHEQKITSQTPESDLNYDNLKDDHIFQNINTISISTIDRVLKKHQMTMKETYRVPFERNSDRLKELRYQYVNRIMALEGHETPHILVFVDEAGFNLAKGRRRGLNIIGHRATVDVPALQQLEQELAGRLLLLTDLSQEQQSELSLKAPTSFQLRIGVARDWPDARAVWVSENRSLLVWVNIDEHLRLVSMREDANVAEAFQCICISLQKLEKYYRGLRHPFIWKQQLGWVTSSPANVGTGLRISVLIKLQHLPTHKHLKDVLKRLRINMDKTDSPELYNISNMATFGFTEVALTQLVVDGVKLLTIMEKRLEGNLSIDELVPAQK